MQQREVWQPVMDCGFTFLLTPDAQLDLYIGRGLNDFATDSIIGAGFHSDLAIKKLPDLIN